MPELKEPHFFSPDLDGPARVRTLEQYLDLFAPAPPGAVCGEASVYYLLSREAPRRIRDFNPDARVIIMLRDPVELMHSIHTLNVVAGTEDVFDFRQALELEGARKQGLGLPSYAITDVYKLYYRELARYSGHIERYLIEFGRDQVHIIIHEEYRKAPKGVLGKVCDFLGVADCPEIEAEVINENRQWRSKWLMTLIRKPPGIVRAAARGLIPRSVRFRLASLLIDANLAKRSRPPLDPLLRAELGEEFQPEIERLGLILGRDLSLWCRPRNPSSGGREPVRWSGRGP